MDFKKIWEENRNGGRDILLMKHPCGSPHGPQWRDMLPCGNGRVGALMSGAAGTDTIILTRHDLWAGSRQTGSLPSLKNELQQMRELITQGKYLEARDIMYHALQDSDYSQEIAKPFPLGCIKLQTLDLEETFSGYRRGIHMDTGEVFAQWHYGTSKVLRRLFVSRNDDILYWHLIDEKSRRYKLDLTWKRREEGSETPVEEEIKNTAKTSYTEDVSATISTGKFLQYTARVEGASLGAVLYVYPIDGTVRVKNNPSFPKQCLELNGREFLIGVKTFTHEEPEKFFTSGRKKLMEASTSYEDALARHAAIHQELYSRTQINLGAETNLCATNEQLLEEAYEDICSSALYEKLWRFGRYLFLSGTSEQGNPFPLYGLWAGEYELPWAQNVSNENIQMIYWHCMAGGFHEAVRAMIRYYVDQMPALSENARQLFGCRGLYVSGYTAPPSMNGQSSTGPCVPVPVILNWISSGGWLASHFIQYAKYVNDGDWIQENIIPFVIGIARFYADYVSWDGEQCCIIPSVSPENTPGNLMPPNFDEAMSHACPTVKNATMDFAVMKDILTKALWLCRTYENDVTEQETAYWTKILEAIPPYEVNADGAIKEWMAPDLEDNYAHRHISHIYPVFPGNEIRPDCEPEMIAAFRRAVELRQMGSQTGWSFAHTACVWNRFGEGDRALDYLDTFVKSCVQTNFFTVHNDWRHMGSSLDLGDFSTVQLDAIMGLVNAIQEMFLQYSDGTLYVLPAVPTRFKEYNIYGLQFPGGKVNIRAVQKNGQMIREFTVYANRDLRLEIVCSFMKEPVALELKAKESRRFHFQ